MNDATSTNTDSFLPSIGSANDYGSFSAISARLDTRPLLDDIELWLRGSLLRSREDKEGNIIQETVKFGEAKANSVGIQSILSLVSTVVNSHFVQGNWTEQRYEDFVFEFHDSLMWNAWVNLYNWGIKEDDFEVIVDHIVQSVIGFASRLIGNKERESYGTTVRTIENAGGEQKQAFGLFGRR